MNYLLGLLCALCVLVFAYVAIDRAVPDPVNPNTACPCRMQGATMICPEGAFEHLEWRPRTEADGPAPEPPARRSRI